MFRFILFRPEGSPGGDGGGGNGGNGEETPPEPTPPAGTDTDQGTTASAGDVKKANAEAAKFRRELREAQKKVEELESAQKSEAEKLTDRVAKSEKDLEEAGKRERLLRIQVLAPRVGIAHESAEDAAKLFDWSSVKDENDQAELEASLREFVKARPHFAGKVPAGADGGAGGNRGEESQDMNILIRSASGRGPES